MAALPKPWTARLAILCVVYHVVAFVALHVLVPEVSFLRDYVDAYLASSYALLSRTTFLALGIALAAIAWGVRRTIPASAASTAAMVVTAVAVLGFVGVSLFPEGAATLARTTRPATLLTILAFSFILRGHERWQPVGAILPVIAVLPIVLLILTPVTGVLPSMGLAGLANRIVLVLIDTWIVLVARGIANHADA